MSATRDWVLAGRLARRELRVGVRGFGVFLGCLFLGVFAVAAVGSFSAAARAGLDADARSLLGGDLEVRLHHRELDPAQRAFLEARGALSGVVGMRVMAARTAASAPAAGGAAAPETRVLTRLKAVDGHYPLYGAVTLAPDRPLADALAFRDGVHGAVAEVELLQRLGLEVGDRVAVGEAEYQVRATLVTEPDRPLRAFLFAPRLLVARDSLAATGLLEPGSLISHAYRLRLHPGPASGAEVEALAAELERRFPDQGWRVEGFTKAEPRVRYFLDRMEVNLTLVGLCTLLVGGLGVSGGVRGYLGGKLAHIAAMKCLGARSRLLFRAYLLQVLLLAALGSATGVAGGWALPHLVVRVWGPALPLPLRPGLFPGPLLTAAAFGLLVAVLFSLDPLGSANRVSPSVLFRGYVGSWDGGRQWWSGQRRVRVAQLVVTALLVVLAVAASGDPRLALWFCAGAALCLALFRLLAGGVVRAVRAAPRVRGPRVRLAVANVGRPGSPATAAIFSLGMGLTALVTVVLVQRSLGVLVEETVPEAAPSFFFLDIRPDQVDAFERAAQERDGVSRVERQPTLRGRITRIAGVPVAAARIAPESSWAVRGDRFLSYAARPPRPAEVVAGTWWPADYAGPPLISLTADLAEGFGVGVGDTLGLNVLGREFEAEIANLREVDWSTLALNFAVIFDPGTLAQAPHTFLASVYARPTAEQEVFDAVTERFPNVFAIRTRALLRGVAATLDRIGAAFRAMAALAVAAGILVLAGAVSADQRRRIRDAVIFKVCGATRADILGAYAAEFLLVGSAAAAVSAVMGTAVAYAVVEAVMDADFRFRPAAVLLTVLLGLGITLILGLLGTARALTRRPAPYLRHE